MNRSRPYALLISKQSDRVRFNVLFGKWPPNMTLSTLAIMFTRFCTALA